MDAGLLHNGEEGELEFLLQRIEGKPYYVPDRAELLNYADDGYFKMTPQLTALRSYIMTHMWVDQEMVDDLIDDIQLGCSMESPLQDLISEFQRRELTFKNTQQAEQIISLLVDVSNHTRLWSNCGHTPNELGTGKNVIESKSIDNRTVKVEKVGRNEPCPCGSGLKFKKCCGK